MHTSIRGTSGMTARNSRTRVALCVVLCVHLMSAAASAVHVRPGRQQRAVMHGGGTSEADAPDNPDCPECLRHAGVVGAHDCRCSGSRIHRAPVVGGRRSRMQEEQLRGAGNEHPRPREFRDNSPNGFHIREWRAREVLVGKNPTLPAGAGVYARFPPTSLFLLLNGARSRARIRVNRPDI